MVNYVTGVKLDLPPSEDTSPPPPLPASRRPRPRTDGRHEARTRMGDLMRAHRKRLGLTRDELGRRCSYSPARISQVEMGDRPPSKALLTKIVEALELDYEDTIELTLAYIADRIMTWN